MKKLHRKLKDDLRRFQLSRRAMRRALLQLTRKPYVILDRRLADFHCGNTQFSTYKKRKQDKHRDDVEKNPRLESSQDSLQQIDKQIIDDKARLDSNTIVGTASVVTANDNIAQTEIQESNLSKKESSDTSQNSVQEAGEKDAHIDNIAISIKDKDISLKKSSLIFRIKRKHFSLPKSESLNKHAQKFVYEFKNKDSHSESKTVSSKDESTSTENINISVNQKCSLLESKSLETNASNLSKIHYSDSKISIDSSESDTVYEKKGKQKEKKKKEKAEITQEFSSSNIKLSDISSDISKLKTYMKTTATEDKNQDVFISKKHVQASSHVDSKLLTEQIDTPSAKIPVQIDINKIEKDLKSTSQQRDNATINMKTTVKRKMSAKYLNENVLPKKMQKNNGENKSPNKCLTVSNTEIFDYDTLSEEEQIYESNASERREKIVKCMIKEKDNMYKLLNLKSEKRGKRKNKKIKKIRERFNNWFRNSMKPSTSERDEEREILLNCLKKKEHQSMKHAFHDITTDEEIEDTYKTTSTNKHEISINISQKDIESANSTKIQHVKNSVVVIDTKDVIRESDTCTGHNEDIVSSTTEVHADENVNKKNTLHLCKNTEKEKYVVSAETEEVNRENVVQNPLHPTQNQEDQGSDVKKSGLINEDITSQECITPNLKLSTASAQEFSNIEEKGNYDVENVLTDDDSNTKSVMTEIIDYPSIMTPQLEKGATEDTCVHENTCEASFMSPSSRKSNVNDNRSSEDHSTDDNFGDIEVEIKIKPKSKSQKYQKFSLKAPWSAVNSCIENLNKLKDNPNSLGELFQMNNRKPESSEYGNTSSNTESNTSGRSLSVNQDVITKSIETVSNTQEVVCNSSSRITKDNHSSQQLSSQDDTTLNENRDGTEHNQEKKDERIQSIEQEKTQITVENNFASTCDTSNLERQSIKTSSGDKEKTDEQQQNCPDVIVSMEDRNITEHNQEETTQHIQSIEQEKTRMAVENSFAPTCEISNLEKQSLKTLSGDKEKADEQQQKSSDVVVLTEDKNITECNQRGTTEHIQSVEQEKTRMAAENSFAPTCKTSNLEKQSLKTLSDDKEKADEQQQKSPDVIILTEDNNITEHNQGEKTKHIQSVEQKKTRMTAENSSESAKSACVAPDLGKQLPNSSTSNATHSKVRVRSSAELGSWWCSSPSMNPNASVTSSTILTSPSISKPPSSCDTANKFLYMEEPQSTENISPNTQTNLRNDLMRLIQIAVSNIWTNVTWCRNICQQKLNILNVCQIQSNMAEVKLNMYKLRTYLQTEDDNCIINYINKYILINQSITNLELFSYVTIVNCWTEYLTKLQTDHSNTTHVSQSAKADNALYEQVLNAAPSNVNAQPFPGNAPLSGTRMPNPANLQSSTTSYRASNAMASNINRQQFSENTVNFSRVSHSRQPIPNIQSTHNVPSTMYVTLPLNVNQQSFVNTGNISHSSLVDVSNINMSASGLTNQGNINAFPTPVNRYSHITSRTTTGSTATLASLLQEVQVSSQTSLQINPRTQLRAHETTNRNIQQTTQTAALNRSATINPNTLRTGAAMGNVRPGNSPMNLQTQGPQVLPVRTSLPPYNPLNPNIITSQPNVCAQAYAQNIPLNLNSQQQNLRQSQHTNLTKDMSKRVNPSNDNITHNMQQSVLTTKTKTPNSKTRVCMSNKLSSPKPQQNKHQETSSAHVSQDLLGTVPKTSQKPNILQNKTPNVPSQGGTSALFSAKAQRSNETINYNFNLQILTDIQKIVLRNQLHSYFYMNEHRHLFKQQEFEKLQYEKRILYSFFESLHDFINNLQIAYERTTANPPNRVSQNMPVQENKIQSSTDKITKTLSDQSNKNNSACDKIPEKQPLKSNDSNIPTNSKSITVESNLSIEVSQNRESFVTPKSTTTEELSPGTIELQKQTRDTPKMRFKKHVSIDMEKRSEKSLPEHSNTPDESSIAQVIRKNSEMKAQDKTQINKTVKSPAEKIYDEQLPRSCFSFVQNTSNLLQDISIDKITAKDQSEDRGNNVNTKRHDNITAKNICKISNVTLDNNDKNDTASQSSHNTKNQNKKICDVNDEISSENSKDGTFDNVKENIEKSKTDFTKIQSDSTYVRTSTPNTSNNTSELISLIKECQSVETLQTYTTCIKFTETLSEFSLNAQQENSMNERADNSEDGTFDNSGRLYIDESAGRSSLDLQQQHDKVSSSKEDKSDTSLNLSFDAVKCRSTEIISKSSLVENEIDLTDMCQSLTEDAKKFNEPSSSKKTVPEFCLNAQQEDPTNEQISNSEEAYDIASESSERLYKSARKSFLDLEQEQRDKISSSEENKLDTSGDLSRSFDAVRHKAVEIISQIISPSLPENKIDLTNIHQSSVAEVQDVKRLNELSLIKSEEIIPELYLNAQQEDSTNEINNSEEAYDGASESSDKLYKSRRKSFLEQEQRDISSSEENKLDTSQDLSRSFDAVRHKAVEILSLPSLPENKIDLTNIYQFNLVAEDVKRFNKPSLIKSEEIIPKLYLNAQQEDSMNEQINHSEEPHDGVFKNSGRLYVDESTTRSWQQEQCDKIPFFETDKLDTLLDSSLSFDAIKCESMEITSLPLLEETKVDLAVIYQNLVTLKSELKKEPAQVQKILPFEVPEGASNIGENIVQSINTIEQSEDTNENNIKIDTHSGIKAINEGLKYVSEQKHYTKLRISSSMLKSNFTDAKIKEDTKNDIFKDDIDEWSSVKSDDSDIMIVPNIVNVRSISPSLFEKIDNINNLNTFPQNNLETLTEKRETKSLNISGNPEISEDIEDKPCLRCKRKSTVYCQDCLEAHYCSKRCSSLHWNAEHYKHCKNRELIDI